jgi:hypothetical protein
MMRLVGIYTKGLSERMKVKREQEPKMYHITTISNATIYKNVALGFQIFYSELS